MENKKIIMNPTVSMALKVALLTFMILIFLIPLSMITSLVYERKSRSIGVEAEIINLYGGNQTICGPVISIAYIERYRSQYDKDIWEEVTRHAFFTSETLTAEIGMTTDIRKRGIYEVPVYDITVMLEGEFLYPEFEKLNIDPDSVIWEQSGISIDLNDMRAVSDEVSFEWNGEQYKLESGPSLTGVNGQAMFLRLPEIKEGETYPFRLELDLRGGKSLDFIPTGSKTYVRINSDWSSPSFRGAYLPVKHDIGEDGFTAEWFVPAIGRNFPNSWTDNLNIASKIRSTEFGFNLFTPVDHYVLSVRSVKYGLLFILLPFLCFFLFENLWKLKIHFLQYLLVGAVECVFYLLLLSVSEHAGFTGAFILAATVTTLLITYYAHFFVKSWQKTAFLSGLLVVSYIFLFVVIQNEDYSLLIGSIGLFLILAIVMITTRKMDWYKLSRR